MALIAVAAISAQPTVAGTGYFSRRGISFTYAPSWNVTTQPLSNGLEPLCRFAVGNFSFHRTPRDIGPCLEGIAKQRLGDRFAGRLAEHPEIRCAPRGA